MDLSIVTSQANEKKITPPIMYTFEKSKIIEKRVDQLNEGYRSTIEDIIKKENITCNSTKAVWVDGFMMLDNTTTCSAAGVKVDLTGKKTHYYENKLCVSGKAVLNYIPCSAAKDFNMI